MKFTEVHLFADTGFSERGVRVPSPRSELPVSTAIWTAYDVRPPKGDVLSKMDLPIDFLFIQSATYLRGNLLSVDGTDFTFFGWIDSIEPKTDSADTPVTTIRWHVDLWRTWIERAHLGRGTVTRRKAQGSYPMQRFTPRFNRVGWYKPLIEDFRVSGYYWAIVGYVRDVDEETTVNSYLCFPFRVTYASVAVMVNDGVVHLAPSGENVFTGAFDEMLGLTPSRIVGAWVTTTPPLEYEVVQVSTETYRGECVKVDRYGSPRVMSHGEWSCLLLDSSALESPRVTTIPKVIVGDLEAFQLRSVDSPSSTEEVDALVSTELSSLHVVNHRGEIVGSLPPRVPFDQVRVRNILSMDGCYLAVRFESRVIAQHHQHFADANGCEIHIPLPTIPVSGNSWSEYVYSGQRQYEISQMNAEQDIAHTKGQASVVEGGISGAFAGAVAGSGPGAIAGGIIGAIGSFLGNEVSYATDKAWNDQLIGQTDTYQAKQSENIIINGSAFDWITYGVPTCAVVEIIPDVYSGEQFNASLNLNGVEVSEPKGAVELPASGPFQVRDLEVLGAVPNAARAFIKARLESGVYIVR